jgi:hypothetical protein
MPKPAKKSLSLVASPDFKVAANGTKKLKVTTIKQVAAVAKLDAQTTTGAIIAGFNLHRVKTSCEHGEFGKFLQNDLAKAMGWTAGTATTNASYYMRLSTAFYETSGLKEAQVIAALDGSKAARKALGDALQKFIDGHSLTELLIQHGIKGVGLKTALEDSKPAPAGDDEQTTEDKIAQARTQAWEESYKAVESIRAALTEPEKLQLLNDPKQLETLKGQIVEINKLADERIAALRKANAA